MGCCRQGRRNQCPGEEIKASDRVYYERDIAQILGEPTRTHGAHLYNFPKLRKMRATDGISGDLIAYLDEEIPQLTELAASDDWPVCGWTGDKAFHTS